MGYCVVKINNFKLFINICLSQVILNNILEHLVYLHEKCDIRHIFEEIKFQGCHRFFI